MAPGKTGGWSDDHEDNGLAPAEAGEMFWKRPHATPRAPFVPRLGISGAAEECIVAYALPLLRRIIAAGGAPLVIAHAADGWGLADRLRHALRDTLDPARIVAVTPEPEGAPAALFAAIATELTARFPDARILVLVGDGDAAPVLLAPALVHYTVGVLDLAMHSLLPSAALMSADCLLLHAPGDTTPALDAFIAAVFARRGHLPTSLVRAVNAADLDAVFALIWADLIGEPLSGRAPSSASPG